MADWASMWRLELFNKGLAELRERTVPFLSETQCLRVNMCAAPLAVVQLS